MISNETDQTNFHENIIINKQKTHKRIYIQFSVVIKPPLFVPNYNR